MGLPGGSVNENFFAIPLSYGINRLIASMNSNLSRRFSSETVQNAVVNGASVIRTCK